jgi:hypothetical protein
MARSRGLGDVYKRQRFNLILMGVILWQAYLRRHR